MDAKAKDDRALDITAVAADPEPHRGNLNHIGIVLQDELDGTMAEQMKAAHAALMGYDRHARMTGHGPARHVALNLMIKPSLAFAPVPRARERRRRQGIGQQIRGITPCSSPPAARWRAARNRPLAKSEE